MDKPDAEPYKAWQGTVSMLKIKFRFDGRHRDSYTPTPPWRLNTLFVNLTEVCNQACSYCHADVDTPRQAMPLELLQRVLDDASAMGKPAVVLTGGEPLLYPHLEQVLGACQQQSLPCKIASNGVLIDNAMLARLSHFGVRSLQVSLDTCDPALYAMLRNTGARAHAQAIAGIERCLASDAIHVVISAVATRQTRSGLAELLRFCQQLGVATFTLYHVVPFGRAHRADRDWLSEPDFIALCDELLAEFARLPRHVAVDLSVPWAAGSSLLSRWRERLDIQPVGCIAGKTSMTMLVDGHAVPCVCLEDRNFSCGNIAESSLAELWQSPMMQLFRGEAPVQGCQGCPELDFCLGGCRALAFLHHGVADAPDPACELWGCRRPGAAVQERTL